MAKQNPPSLQDISAFIIVTDGIPISLLPKILQNYVNYVQRKAILSGALSVTQEEMPYGGEWLTGGYKLLNLLTNEDSYIYYCSLYQRLRGMRALEVIHRIELTPCIITQVIYKNYKDRKMTQNDYFNNKLDRSTLVKNLKPCTLEEKEMCN